MERIEMLESLVEKLADRVSGLEVELWDRKLDKILSDREDRIIEQSS